MRLFAIYSFKLKKKKFFNLKYPIKFIKIQKYLKFHPNFIW